MLLSSEAQKKLCPVIDVKTPTGNCLGHMCMGWDTHEEIKHEREVADKVFIDAYTIHEVMSPEPSSIFVGIFDGKIKKKTIRKNDSEEVVEITHEEIMNTMDERGRRLWLAKIDKRKPTAGIETDNSMRNIQYNTEDKLFYHIFNKPTIDYKGKCKLM